MAGRRHVVVEDQLTLMQPHPIDLRLEIDVRSEVIAHAQRQVALGRLKGRLIFSDCGNQRLKWRQGRQPGDTRLPEVVGEGKLRVRRELAESIAEQHQTGVEFRSLQVVRVQVHVHERSLQGVAFVSGTDLGPVRILLRAAQLASQRDGLWKAGLSERRRDRISAPGDVYLHECGACLPVPEQIIGGDSQDRVIVDGHHRAIRLRDVERPFAAEQADPADAAAEPAAERRVESLELIPRQQAVHLHRRPDGEVGVADVKRVGQQIQAETDLAGTHHDCRAGLVTEEGSLELRSPRAILVSLDRALHLRIERCGYLAGHLQSEDRVGAEVDLTGARSVTLADVAAISQAAGVLINRADGAKGTERKARIGESVCAHYGCPQSQQHGEGETAEYHPRQSTRALTPASATLVKRSHVPQYREWPDLMMTKLPGAILERECPPAQLGAGTGPSVPATSRCDSTTFASSAMGGWCCRM